MQPDVVLLGAEWRARALIRAQLIEEGYEVLAADSWSVVRHFIRAGSKPSLVIVDLVDLVDLEHSMDVLRELRELMQPDRVLVLAGLGTVAPAELEWLGFRVLRRPVTIRDIVAAAAQAMEH